MPEVSEKRDGGSKPGSGISGSGFNQDPDIVEELLAKVICNGDLPSLIAKACEEATKPYLASDPAWHAYPSVQAASRAYAARAGAEENAIATDIGRVSDREDRIEQEPEILPLSLAGHWVAWSADGMRIVAAAKTIEEVEGLAAEAGEPEPILDFHPGPRRS